MTSVPVSKSTNAVLECKHRLCASVENVSKLVDPQRCAIILSGGVDTCAILEAASSINWKFVAAITVVIGDKSPDEKFAKHAASLHGIPHYVVEMTAEDLVNEYLPETVKLLQTWDGMTLRNSLVISAACKEARRLGMRDVVVGDGADELFGGYSFMWGMEDDTLQWKKKRDDMCRKWTFSTPKLAQSYGIKAHGPFMDETFVSWALATTREDCIGERPIKLVLEGESIMHKVGKIVLREAFDTCASWRRKDPIEVGSGAAVIANNEFWSEQLSDEKYKEKVTSLEEQGILIRSKEHLINFRSYVKIFGGIRHPEKKRMPLHEGCAGCCFEIGDNNFCSLCGMWPAQRNVKVT